MLASLSKPAMGCDSSVEVLTGWVRPMNSPNSSDSRQSTTGRNGTNRSGRQLCWKSNKLLMPTTTRHRRQQLRVSSYDRVSSWLVSLLIMTCVTVGALVIIFFTRKFILADVSMPVTPVATGGGGTGGDVGTEGGSELEAPGVEDAPPVNEPQTLETLSGVASAVSSRTAILADEQIDVGVQPTSGTGVGDRRTPGFGGGRGGGIGGGIGSGSGPGRNNGPGEPRREIRFEPANVKEYAQWLD